MADLQWNRSFALEQAGDEEEVLTELLDLFRQSCAADLGKIKQGLQERKSQEIADAAHSIKGAAASLGIEGIRQIAYAMEKAGREERLEKVNRDLSDLESMISALDQLH